MKSIRLCLLISDALKMSFFKKIIRVWLIYNVSLVLGIQQSESVIHIHISTLFRFFSHIGHYRVLSRVPYDKDLL